MGSLSDFRPVLSFGNMCSVDSVHLREIAHKHQMDFVCVCGHCRSLGPHHHIVAVLLSKLRLARSRRLGVDYDFETGSQSDINRSNFDLLLLDDRVSISSLR